MEAQLQRLKAILAEVADLNGAAAVLEWDQQTFMPPGGAEDRGNQQATLSRLSHVTFTSPEVGRLLEALEPHTAQLAPDSDEARLIRVTAREFRKRTRVPADMVAELAQATTAAIQVWQEARAENNFAKFAPHLTKIVDLRRRYARLFEPFDHVYDPLLDDFEPGIKTAEVKKIFADLRPRQVTLIKAIADKPQVDDSFLHKTYDEQKQWDFGVDVITRFGYDWNRGRQDKAAHPFTTNFGLGDVRITTRVFKDSVTSALFSTLHEAGHGMYEQGISPTLSRTPLGGGASLALHESQSRMWENLVGRSLPFWQYFYPRLQETFPEPLRGVSLDSFYKGINKVERSLIRIESDEATYNLHIMLRLELEIALMEGSLEVAGLPNAWNNRMVEYLGIEPPNDSKGVLQDVHWSSGAIGYFSTYALGNLISAQLWERIHKEMPDVDDQIRRGEFSGLLGWLREKIHRHGSKFEPQEFVERVTGSKINPDPYVRYLTEKFSKIYSL
jgi:carboxypeptidase Taq